MSPIPVFFSGIYGITSYYQYYFKGNLIISRKFAKTYTDIAPFFCEFQGLLSSTQSWLVVSTHLKNISQIGSFPQVGVKIEKQFETTTQRVMLQSKIRPFCVSQLDDSMTPFLPQDLGISWNIWISRGSGWLS